ncbi:alpha/beta hydrolase [Steroidobacter sp.]|uniref:alpha/beta hydrolase n=1 Tax=Steroidobacter sp. TaxID=1978227 RepID=UPI001A55592E|nr:alpha/beta hydrolase [Steroidobacter sp.]MBL8271937.1 alpha/beta hydrolase [Steroidobacter sp.]
MKHIAKIAAVAAILLTSFTAAAAEPTSKYDPRKTIAAEQMLPRDGIDEMLAIPINETKQWLSIRGARADNPILLYIHGGPGAPMMAESWTFQRPWEDYFTVVQWDQRGSGKTFSEARRQWDPRTTVDQLVDDAEQVALYLRRHYGKQKIFLLGHSFGSILGVRLAQRHPDWFYAYIGLGQIVNGRRNEAAGYDWTLAEAKRRGDARAIKELEAIAPYPERDGTVLPKKTQIQRGWAVQYGAMLHGIAEDDESRRRSLSPAYDDYDLLSTQLGQDLSGERLWIEGMKTDFDQKTRFNCPVILMGGRYDNITATTVARAWFDTLDAPKKAFVQFDRAAHYVVNEVPGEMLIALVTQVRPLAGADLPPP